jgi:uncharacterized membrane protein YfcA
MNSTVISHILLVGAIFMLAGAVKGISGMGLPTVAMSLLGLWMPATQAAALLIMPSLATNLAQCRGPHGRSLARRLWPLWLGLATTAFCAPGLGGGSEATARRLLGAALVSYGVWGLWRLNLPQLSAEQRWVGAMAGLLTGAVTAATAVFVLPMVPYLQALRFDKDEMVQALGLSFGVATLALAMRLGLGLEPSAGSRWLTPLSAWALGASFAGLWLGTRLRAALSGAAFQRSLFVIFIGLGVANLLKPG